MKKCTKCGIERPISEFTKDRRNKDGLRLSCKTCTSDYLSANIDRKREYDKRYREANKERIKKIDAQYYIKNRDTILQRTAAYYTANREKRRAYGRSYHKKNREKHLAYAAKYRLEHADKRHEWYRANLDRVRASKRLRRARKRGNGGIHTAEDVLRQGEVQRWRCWWCGQSCRDDYHVDHMIPLAKGGHNNPGNIVISCPFCNLSKRDRLPEEWAKRLF